MSAPTRQLCAEQNSFAAASRFGRSETGSPPPVGNADRRARHPAQLVRLEIERLAAGLGGRNSDKLEHMGETPNGVGAAAETKKIDAVAGPPDTENGDIAVDDFFGDASAIGLLNVLLGALPPCNFAGDRRADAGHIKCELLRGIDRELRANSCRPEKTVDVGAALVG